MDFNLYSGTECRYSEDEKVTELLVRIEAACKKLGIKCKYDRRNAPGAKFLRRHLFQLTLLVDVPPNMRRAINMDPVPWQGILTEPRKYIVTQRD